MNSSFKPEDVTLLLKDITGQMEPLPTAERERRIQGGAHYSEMLPLEYRPTEEYTALYEKALAVYGQRTADAAAALGEKIIRKKGERAVIVSLARAGTPVGVLVRRYIRGKYGIDCPHYSVSIIRDRGMDRNAMAYILQRHRAEDLQFLDGWTGKGVIYCELRKEIASFPGVSDELAVAADPAGLTEMCGTHEDIIIPSSCLNCTVCGLISRTVLKEGLIGEKDFHGAVYYGELAAEDRTYEFIDTVEARFRFGTEPREEEYRGPAGMDTVREIEREYGVRDIHFIKPGIGETTRVLLRRVPWKVLIDPERKNDGELEPVRQLAREKQVDIEYYPLGNYKCCGTIRQLPDI